MSELTAAEAQELLLGYTTTFRNYYDELTEYTVSGFEDYWTEEVTEADFEGIGVFEVIETRGGEGEGDSASVVFRFLPDDSLTYRYFRVDGSYSSFGDGADFTYRPLREVQLKERVVKFYE